MKKKLLLALFGTLRHYQGSRMAFLPQDVLLKGGGEDVKTVQELMRHASSRLTLDVYAQALTPAKRAAHLKVVEMIQPTAETASVPLCSHAEEEESVSA